MLNNTDVISTLTHSTPPPHSPTPYPIPSFTPRSAVPASCDSSHPDAFEVFTSQAGVDLGSVRADQEADKKRRGKKQGAPLAQLRPKRRAPISQVLLVGGSTRMPALRRFVQHMTGLEPATFVQPDEVGPGPPARSCPSQCLACALLGCQRSEPSC